LGTSPQKTLGIGAVVTPAKWMVLETGALALT
jgi:hypothetical protein